MPDMMILVRRYYVIRGLWGRKPDSCRVVVMTYPAQNYQ